MTEDLCGHGTIIISGGMAMKKEFNPMMEIFDPFKVPFSEKSEKKDNVFNERDMDACCACTACSACSACR